MNRDRESRAQKQERRRQKEEAVRIHRERVKSDLARQEAREKGLAASQQDFICPLKFSNVLPNVPVDSKLLPFPYDTQEPYQYNLRRALALEETYQYDLHAELDLGVSVNLLDHKQLKPAESEYGAKRDPLDNAIIDRSLHFAAITRKTGVVGTATKQDWLLAPEVTHKSMTVEQRVRVEDPERVRLQQQTEALAKRDRPVAATRVERILNSFEACSAEAPIVHPSKPHLKPKRAWTVLPDVKRWPVEFAAVSYDHHPHDGVDVPPGEKKRRLSQAVIRTPDAATAARGLYACLYLPHKGDTPSEDGGGTNFSYVRGYNLDLAAVENDALDELLMVFDDDALTASFVPLTASGQMTKVKASMVPARRLSVERRKPMRAESSAAAKATTLFEPGADRIAPAAGAGAGAGAGASAGALHDALFMRDSDSESD